MILGWIAIIAVLNTVVPQLDIVGQMRSVSMSPDDAQSVIATKHMGEVFNEYKSNSSVMIVLEGQNALGKDAHAYYDQIVKKLDADTKHVEHVQDMWSDPLSGAGVQSNDAKAAYVQVYLAGNQGEALANESVEAVQQIVKSVPTPNGVKAYVTGPAALSADQHIAGDRSLQLITTVTFLVIIAMLLLVYRSIVTMVLTLAMVMLELAAARGMVAFLGYYKIIGLSTFATNLLVTLAIAAATDYAIFLIGRYQEARAVGESREDAYYTMFGGTAHVVLGSGMTIAGATFCLHFTNLPYFQTLGIPLAIGMVVVVRRGVDAWPCGDFGGVPLPSSARATANTAHSRLAQDRRPRCPMARPDPDRDHRGRACGPADPARLPDQLQRPQLPARRPAGERRLRGRGSAFLAGADEPRAADDRK